MRICIFTIVALLWGQVSFAGSFNSRISSVYEIPGLSSSMAKIVPILAKAIDSAEALAKYNAGQNMLSHMNLLSNGEYIDQVDISPKYVIRVTLLHNPNSSIYPGGFPESRALSGKRIALVPAAITYDGNILMRNPRVEAAILKAKDISLQEVAGYREDYFVSRYITSSSLITYQCFTDIDHGVRLAQNNPATPLGEISIIGRNVYTIGSPINKCIYDPQIVNESW